jgi:hypothetical protein
MGNVDNYPGESPAPRFSPTHTDERILAELIQMRNLLQDLVEQGQTKQPRRRSTETATHWTSSPSRRWVMAQSFMTIVLREKGPMSWADLVAAGDGKHSERTMRKMRSSIAEKFVEDGRWFWRLKGQEGMGNGSAHRHD